MVKLVDAQDLGSCVERRGGSNPSRGTISLTFLIGVWAPMYQGGENALQAICGRFDPDGVHQNE